MDSANEFYEISQVSSQLVAARSIVLAGRTHRVNKIMTYKMSWMLKNYSEPIRRQAQRFSKKNRSSRCIISTLLYYIVCSASNISSNQYINSDLNIIKTYHITEC
jgi:hypothetical protein